MGNEAAIRVRSMDDIRDWVERRYARFTTEPLSDGDMMALGRAKMVLPEASVGDKLFLTKVSDAACYRWELAQWGAMVAGAIAPARYKRRNGQRRRAYCEAYRREWGAQAALDGLALAVYGHCPSLEDRARWFDLAPQTYQKIRDFVGGVAVDAINEFAFALEWAHGLRRDRMFDGRFEALTGLKLGND